MIIEMRTYKLKPGNIPTFEERFAAALSIREKFSKLAAFWHTEVGPLNQVIHVWPYESLDQRASVRAEAAKAEGWPPNTRELTIEQKSEIFLPAPFSPPLEPRQLGGIYEIRMYTYAPGTLPAEVVEVADSVEAALDLQSQLALSLAQHLAPHPVITAITGQLMAIHTPTAAVTMMAMPLAMASSASQEQFSVARTAADIFANNEFKKRPTGRFFTSTNACGHQWDVWCRAEALSKPFETNRPVPRHPQAYDAAYHAPAYYGDACCAAPIAADSAATTQQARRAPRPATVHCSHSLKIAGEAWIPD